MKKGYTNVYRFTGGHAEWRSFNYPVIRNNKYNDIKINRIAPKEVYELLTKNNVLLIDVRPKKFKAGRTFIANSVNYPLLTITDQLDSISRDQKIILTDWTMRQSPLAAKYLMANGFDNILGVLKGGIIRWAAEGYPAERREIQEK